MKLDVITLDAGSAGSIELDDAIFGLEPRKDILHRVVRWQLAKRRAGTHSVPGHREISYSTKKIYKPEGHRRRPARLAQGADLPPRRHLHRAGRRAATRTT